MPHGLASSTAAPVSLSQGTKGSPDSSGPGQPPVSCASRTPNGRLSVSLGVALSASQGSKFGVHHKPPEYNLPPAPPSGWSGGTLDKPWTCPGTIEPPQTPVFDQSSLSKPPSCGIGAAERFGCGADLWSAGARSLRLCGPCSAKLGRRFDQANLHAQLVPAYQAGAQALLDRADEPPLAQNSLPTARPRTLSGPWSSRPSVAWSSFCNVSFAFL